MDFKDYLSWSFKAATKTDLDYCHPTIVHIFGNYSSLQTLDPGTKRGSIPLNLKNEDDEAKSEKSNKVMQAVD